MFDSSKQRYREFRAQQRAGSSGDTATGDDAVKLSREQRKRYMRDYRSFLWPFKRTFVAVFLLALLSAALSMLPPLATRYIIDRVLPGTDLSTDEKWSQILFLCGAIVAILFLVQAFDTARGYSIAVLNAKVIFRLRQKLFDRLIRLPLGKIGELKSGGIVSRLSQDTDKVTGMVQMAIVTPAVATMRVVLTVTVLLFISWPLALLAGMMIPPLVGVNLIWIRKVRPIYRAMAQARSDIDARVTETFGGIRVVRAFRRERKERREYAVTHHTIIRKKLLAERLRLIVSAGWGLLIPAISLSVVGFGSYLVIHGRGTIGDIIAFQMYAFMLLQPVTQIVYAMSATQQALAASERIFDAMTWAEEKPDVPDAVDAPTPITNILFDEVNFEYREGVPVLFDISLDIPAGSTVALVGPSGGGKSTLTDLVARFHDPTTGTIRANGIDLRDIRLMSYRRKLATVPQEVFLFDGTVRDNIAYGRRLATDADIIDAATRANAHEFIESLPEGYDTLIGERGIKLSGGQRQRLSIARAILADPEILILDEATSNLDTESEQLIQASLRDLLSDRTTFVIAHRLSTITHADLIVVLDAGRVVQSGTHAELMAEDGLYRYMVERQQHTFAAETGAIEWD